MSRITLISVVLLLLFGMSAQAQSDPPYKMTKTVKPDGEKGGAIFLSVRPAKGHKVNKDFPLLFKASAAEGLTLPKSMLRNKDALRLDDKALDLKLEYFVSDPPPAKKMIEAVIRFGICEIKNGQVARCTLHNEKLEYDLDSPQKPEQAKLP